MDKNNLLSAILGALLVVSETLGLTDKVKSNSVAQLVFSFIAKIFGS